jgi:hypothetical protein
LVNQRIRPAKMSFWQYAGPEAHEFHFVGKSWMYRRIDPARISGDSPGGSAVALACGMVPLAVGYRPSLGLCRRPAGNRMDSIPGRWTELSNGCRWVSRS